MEYTFRPWVYYKNDSVFQRLYEEVGLITGNSRKDKGPRSIARRKCLNRVIANLHHTKVEQLIVLLSRDQYTTGTLYHQYKCRGGITYANMRDVLEKLIDCGYIDVKVGDIFPVSGTRYSNIRIRSKLRNFFETLNHSDIDYDPIPLRIMEKKFDTKKGKDVDLFVIPEEGDYSDSTWTHLEDITTTMERYNAMIRDVDFSWVPEPLYQAIYGTARPNFCSRYLTAQFKGNPECGGRMYLGFWINMHQPGRAYLKIDGEKILDFDFSHFFVQLVYEKANKAMGTNIPVPGQPYLYEKSENPRLRKLAKIFFQIILNSHDKSKRTAKNAAADYIKAYKKKHEAKVGKWDKEVYLKVIADLIELHKSIESFYTGDIWGTLQKAESDIMRSIMNKCMDLKIVILPIHDGFLCKECDGLKVRDILDGIGYKYRYVWASEMKREWKSRFKFKDLKPHKGWKGPQKMAFNEKSFQWEPMKLNGVYSGADLTQFWGKEKKSYSSFQESSICLSGSNSQFPEEKTILKCSVVPWKCRKVYPPEPEALTKTERILLHAKDYCWVLSRTEMKAILVPGYQTCQYKSLDEWNNYVDRHNKNLGLGDWTAEILQFFSP